MGIQIEKRAEKVGIILAKKKINNIPAQVKLGIDKSGSMDHLYEDGTVQDVVERILAVGMKFDMDQSIDVFAFHNRSFPVKTVTFPIMENYVKKEIEQKIGWGGTSYSPCLKDIRDSSQGEKGKKGFFGFGKTTDKPADPTLAILITDGANDDESDSEIIFKESQAENIYWLLVGIGRERFSFIRKMGDKYPNVGFVAIDDISKIDDDDLFEALLNDELAAWFKKFQK
jgi:hypothetical protein